MGKQLTNLKIRLIAGTEGPSRVVGKMYGVSHKTVVWIRNRHPRYSKVLDARRT